MFRISFETVFTCCEVLSESGQSDRNGQPYTGAQVRARSMSPIRTETVFTCFEVLSESGQSDRNGQPYTTEAQERSRCLRLGPRQFSRAVKCSRNLAKLTDMASPSYTGAQVRARCLRLGSRQFSRAVKCSRNPAKLTEMASLHYWSASARSLLVSDQGGDSFHVLSNALGIWPN